MLIGKFHDGNFNLCLYSNGYSVNYHPKKKNKPLLHIATKLLKIHGYQCKTLG